MAARQVVQVAGRADLMRSTGVASGGGMLAAVLTVPDSRAAGCASQHAHRVQEVLSIAVAGGRGTETLLLWGEGPKWEHSTVPLVKADGSLVAAPTVGRAGHAIGLSGNQVPPRSWLLCWVRRTGQPALARAATRRRPARMMLVLGGAVVQGWLACWHARLASASSCLLALERCITQTTMCSLGADGGAAMSLEPGQGDAPGAACSTQQRCPRLGAGRR